MQNPFSYSFGIKPKVYVDSFQYEEMLKEYMYEEPAERAYMITGVRGSGKTVMLSQISEALKAREDWVVIDLNRESDLLQSLAANLYDLPILKPLILDAKIDVSILGIGISIEKKDRIYDIELVIKKLIKLLSKKKIKLMITMDEVHKNDMMKVFCQTFQRLIREHMPVYIIMTGLYKDIHEVKNMEGCTFLNRAPFVIMNALDLSAIAVEYKRVLNVSAEISNKMAKETKGYAFAFQVMGKLCFGQKDNLDLERIIPEYSAELAKYSYRILWEELSETDKKVVRAIVKLGLDKPIKREMLMKELEFSSSMMNRYQIRLREKGVLNSSSNGHGYYTLALPRFGDYIRDFYMD